MRIVRVPMRLCCVLVACTASLSAQTAVRRLSLVPDMRLDAKQYGLHREPIIAIGPTGRVVAASNGGFGEIVAIDSGSPAAVWKLTTGRRDDSEILFPSRIGWIPGTSTVWIADVGYRQLALVDAQGKVFKSVEYPSWIHPAWAERRRYPVFASMEPLAVYKDESMLVIPSRPRSLLDTPGFDRSRTYVVRASWTGTIQRIVAQLPDDPTRILLDRRGCNHIISVPMSARPFWAVSSDGARIVIAKPGASAADSGIIRVTAIGERGDTVFSRAMPQSVVRTPAPSVESFLSSIRSCGSYTAEELRDSATKRISSFRSLLTGVVAGSDNSTWVITRSPVDTSRDLAATLLDARGTLIGTLALPPNSTPVAGDANHLWVLEMARMRMPAALVRYRVKM